MDTDTPLRTTLFLDKGGTGKTTSTAHLGVAADRLGYNVLLLDLAGKQGDLTKQFGLWSEVKEDAEDTWPNIATVFKDEWPQVVDTLGEEAVDELIMATDEGVDLIPAHPGLDGIDSELSLIDDAQDRYSRLDRFLTQHIDPLGYDLVLIDLPGASNNVTFNGVYATGSVIAPVEMGPFESDQAEQLEEDIDRLNEKLTDADIRLTMIIPNKFEKGTTLDDEYREWFVERFGDVIAPEVVAKSQDVSNAANDGHTMYAIEKPLDTAERAMDAYTRNAEVLIERLQEEQR